MQNKIDFSITPLRLSVVVIGLGLISLNEFFSWGLVWPGYLFPIALILSVYLTQPKQDK